MCSNVILQHSPGHPSKGCSGTQLSNLLRMSPIIPKDQKIYNLRYDDIRGDVFRPPHGTIPAAVKIKYVLNEDPLEARNTLKKRK